MMQASPLIPLIRKVIASVVAAVAALVVTVGVMTYLTWQSTLWVRHTRNVQSTGTRALDLALDRHASIGAYLVTGDSAVLAPGRRAQAALIREMQTLGSLIGDNPDQKARLARVDTAIREWERTYVDPVLDARDGTERASIGREQKAGTATFVQVRSTMESFLNAESALYAERVQQNTMWRAAEIILVGIEALVILIALTYVRRELLSQALRTLEQQSQLEEQAIELEAQAAEQEMLATELQLANQELTDAGMEQEALTADLELANHELT
jgi:CHASE3 domain sensor protein